MEYLDWFKNYNYYDFQVIDLQNKNQNNIFQVWYLQPYLATYLLLLLYSVNVYSTIFQYSLKTACCQNFSNSIYFKDLLLPPFPLCTFNYSPVSKHFHSWIFITHPTGNSQSILVTIYNRSYWKIRLMFDTSYQWVQFLIQYW